MVLRVARYINDYSASCVQREQTLKKRNASKSHFCDCWHKLSNSHIHAVVFYGVCSKRFHRTWQCTTRQRHGISGLCMKLIFGFNGHIYARNHHEIFSKEKQKLSDFPAKSSTWLSLDYCKICYLNTIQNFKGNIFMRMCGVFCACVRVHECRNVRLYERIKTYLLRVGFYVHL